MFGAFAGLLPAIVVGGLFAYDSQATAREVVTALGLVALIGIVAGWLAGPLAGSSPQRFLSAGLAYAMAFIAATGALSVAQGVADAISIHGFDLVEVASAGVGRAAVALAGTTYLIMPAIVIGFAWSGVARALAHLGRLDHIEA
jgi:hypothetical protein